MNYNSSAFNEAVANLMDLERLAKSKRMSSRRFQEMSDDLGSMKSDIDEFNRAPQGNRRRDKRLADERWAGIQAMLAEAEAESEAVRRRSRGLARNARQRPSIEDSFPWRKRRQ